jgi:hypothetical protein
MALLTRLSAAVGVIRADGLGLEGAAGVAQDLYGEAREPRSPGGAAIGGGLADQRGGLGSEAEDHRWSYELRDERRE